MKESIEKEMEFTVHVSDVHRAYQEIKTVVKNTPFEQNIGLSQQFDSKILLKREDLQRVRSFKIRGAYYSMKKLSTTSNLEEIVCASAGNHAQGVAFSCSELNIHGKIFLPKPTPEQKINKIKKFGGNWVEIILDGDTYDDAFQKAKAYSVDKSVPLIHPFDDRDIIAGQATTALEMLESRQENIDILIVPIGGGGLISGVGSYFRQLSPLTKIIGVEAAGASAMKQSIKANKIVRLEQIDSFADGIAVKQVGRLTFDITKSVVDEIITVPEGLICSTILKLYNEEGIVVEPAGAAGVAALTELSEEIKGKTVAVIISGGNNDVIRTQEITEKALLYEGRKKYFIIRFPQRAGALKDFLNILGPNDDITHFEYIKKNNRSTGPALVGIELSKQEDLGLLIQRMTDQQIDYQYMNDSKLLFDWLI